MKTFVLSAKKVITQSVALFLLTSISQVSLAQTTTTASLSNGLKFETYSLQSGTALQVGAKYKFTNVDSTTDAVITIDSLVNGAQLNKIDDNSNGTGYKQAFQPAVQSGGIIGMSYAVFKIEFFIAGTSTSKQMQVFNATALDMDGNSTLKEFVRINAGNGATMNYLVGTPDISVSQMGSGDFMGQNILGVERSGIDTSNFANMFTTSNTAVSSFTVKYGSITSNPSNSVRQFSLYLKQFSYPSTLPVKLSSFTATLGKNNKVDLKWTTASEINVSHFVVERSVDGENYSDAGLVFAYGNATDKTNYIFSDNISNVQSAVVYYRLRSVDLDGKGMYSETRIIKISKQAENSVTITTFPNPVTNEVRIAIPAEWQNKKVTYEVLNANGQTIAKTETGSSSQVETINTSNFSRGFYVVRVSCNGQTAQQKIIK